MLNSDCKTYFYTLGVLFIKVATFLTNLVKSGEKRENGISFSKFKMVAATMLNSGHQAFFNIIDALFSKVAKFPPNLVGIGRKMRERQQFFEIQDGG